MVWWVPSSSLPPPLPREHITDINPHTQAASIPGRAVCALWSSFLTYLERLYAPHDPSFTYPGRLYAPHVPSLTYPGRLSALHDLLLTYPGRLSAQRFLPSPIPGHAVCAEVSLFSLRKRRPICAPLCHISHTSGCTTVCICLPLIPQGVQRWVSLLLASLGGYTTVGIPPASLPGCI